MPIALKSGSLNYLEPSGPVQACNGIGLPLPLPFYSLSSHSSKRILKISPTLIITREDTCGNGLLHHLEGHGEVAKRFDKHHNCLAEASLNFELELNSLGFVIVPHR